MIPAGVIQGILQHPLPRFFYDADAVSNRIAMASSLLDQYYFPIKACPEPEVIRVASEAGCGLDLCSEGDLKLARISGCPADRWKFTSACADDRLLGQLCSAGASLDADSLEQALRWIKAGGTRCGLRIRADLPKNLYGGKFGIPMTEVGIAAQELARAGGLLDGIHLHDQHENLRPAEFAIHLVETLAKVGSNLLSDCRYVNIGGSWPMRFGQPASQHDLRGALKLVREQLKALGFRGELYAEPGRWVVGPCGYWAARVAAVKGHPNGPDHQLVILDTNTPVPCRPSLASFAVIRDGQLLNAPCSTTCDIFGSANTALDTIGANVRLPALVPGDIVVSVGQGAYTRSLIPPFNERERPGSTVLPVHAEIESSESPNRGQAQNPCNLPGVFVFNPFSEAYIARGMAFTPVQHQARLAEDLAGLPQYLCQPGDILLAPKHPSTEFLQSLAKAGFSSPIFLETKTALPENPRLFGPFRTLRPWAWGPDSVELLKPLLGQVSGDSRKANDYFSPGIARLYSKAWSAEFLRQFLLTNSLAARVAQLWLCSQHEAGVTVSTMDEALRAIAAIRQGGHHRVVAKQALGLAGHNAIRLWEPDLLPAQRHWIDQIFKDGQQLVIEPWLQREADFSVQLEMEPNGLRLCGHTGLINDLKGQFLANWAEADYPRHLPKTISALLGVGPESAGDLQHLFHDLFARLETELRMTGYLGPIGIDALLYRDSEANCRLKPVVEINPRYTMGRLTLELMKHVCAGQCGLFRLINQAQLRTEGFTDFIRYADHLDQQHPLQLEGNPPRLRRGALCLSDPAQAQVCLATFEVNESLTWPPSLRAVYPEQF